MGGGECGRRRVLLGVAAWKNPHVPPALPCSWIVPKWNDSECEEMRPGDTQGPRHAVTQVRLCYILGAKEALSVSSIQC